MNLEIQKKLIFTKVIYFFNSIVKYKTDLPLEDVNLCNENYIPQLIDLAELLQKKYRYLSIKDSYITIVYTFFLLNLSEPNEDTIIVSIDEYIKYADDPKMVNFLFFAITINDLMSENGINISSKIRRKIFGMQ